MKQYEKEMVRILESINTNKLTIYSGIFTLNKDLITKKIIINIDENKISNVINLNFNILNFNRFYTFQENVEYVKYKLIPNIQNIVVIQEFTNCEDWDKLLTFLYEIKNVKILAVSSINFSSLFTINKNNSFNLDYKEIIYYPPKYIDCLEQNNSFDINDYLDNGSILTYNNSCEDYEIVRLISDLNLIRLFGIFLNLSKVRNHYHLEKFYLFLLKNIDKKLTLEFIKNNIIKDTYLQMHNTKTFWKYLNLLKDLYIILPIQCISVDRMNIKFSSRFICADHMMFKKVITENKLFLIARNILISEFIKWNSEVYILEHKSDEIGFMGKNKNNEWVIFEYTRFDIRLDRIKEKKNIKLENIHYVPKNIKVKYLHPILEKIKKG